MRFRNTAHALGRKVFLLSICADLWIEFFLTGFTGLTGLG